MFIYRIENPVNTLGPYREWKHSPWLSARHSGSVDHPTPYELGWNRFDYGSSPSHKFAFSSLDALYLWFGTRERILMKGYGFKLVTLEVDQTLYECFRSGQIAYDAIYAKTVITEEINVSYN